MTPAMSLRMWLGSIFTSAVTSESPFPLLLPETQIRYTYNGSAALYQATQSLGLGSGDAVLLPAYCCGAEIGPFEHIGCELLFYDVDELLNAKTNQIVQIIEQRRDIRALLITHYFGFAQQDTLRIKQLCEDSSIALVEDCAHSLYGKHNDTPLGSFGSHAIFSPRKTLPLTEGGLYISNLTAPHESSVPDGEQPDLLPWLQRVLYSLQQFYRSDNTQKINAVFTVLMIGMLAAPAIIVKVLKRLGPFKNAVWLTADVEGDAAAQIYPVSMSKTMRRLLHNTDAHSVVAKRRDNYQCWLNEFSASDNNIPAKPLFELLPEHCCPLYFPLIVNNPAELVKALKIADIESFNWWQHMHPAVDWEHFPVAKQMKQSIIALPAHQNLDSQQIVRMANRIKAVLHSCS